MNMQSFTHSTGWRRRGLAMLLGACAASALPPVYILPLLIPAFSGLFLLVYHAQTRRHAFFDGWWWGLGYFVPGLYWMCISLYVEPEKFAWLTPFALFGVPSVLAIYIGLTALFLRQFSTWIKTSAYVARFWNECAAVVLFAGLWVVTEVLRSILFTGFPWNLIGYAWTVSDVTLQLAALGSVYSLSWVTVIVATMPALYILQSTLAKRANLLTLTLFALMIGFGFYRLAQHPTQYTSIMVRVVQGNIEQGLKWNPKTALENLQKYVTLMQRPGLENVQVVVWPETAIPYPVDAGSQLMQDLGSFLPDKTLLMAGGMRFEENEKGHNAWNSFFAINHAGEIVSSYDKHHLVPFGEFVPLRHILPVENIAGGIGDFSRGKGPATFLADNIPAYSPLICYEAIFPAEATDKTGLAQWLVNITNDAWFGKSSGPFQHLEMARTRAVEQGLPLVRAANTGISAIFDALGHKTSEIALGNTGVVDGYLPAALPEGTLYAQNPWIWWVFLTGLSVLVIMACRTKNSIYKN